jgi:hypothetical protein
VDGFEVMEGIGAAFSGVAPVSLNGICCVIVGAVVLGIVMSFENYVENLLTDQD